MIFISYVHDDSAAFVDELSRHLEVMGYVAWTDRNKGAPGDTVLELVNEGLKSCSVGVLIVSRKYARSRWTKLEATHLFSRRDVPILIIRHNLSHEKMVEALPLFQGLLAFDSTEDTVGNIARKLVAKIDTHCTHAVNQWGGYHISAVPSRHRVAADLAEILLQNGIARVSVEDPVEFIELAEAAASQIVARTHEHVGLLQLNGQTELLQYTRLGLSYDTQRLLLAVTGMGPHELGGISRHQQHNTMNPDYILLQMAHESAGADVVLEDVSSQDCSEYITSVLGLTLEADALRRVVQAVGAASWRLRLSSVALGSLMYFGGANVHNSLWSQYGGVDRLLSTDIPHRHLFRMLVWDNLTQSERIALTVLSLVGEVAARDIARPVLLQLLRRLGVADGASAVMDRLAASPLCSTSDGTVAVPPQAKKLLMPLTRGSRTTNLLL